MMLFVFAVNAQPAFTIYSKTIRAEEVAGDVDKAVGVLSRTFAEEYAKNNNLEPTAAELAAMKRQFDSAKAGLPSQPVLDQAHLKAEFMKKGMSDEQATEEASKVAVRAAESARKISEAWISSIMLSFKLNRYLWQKHGGKVVLSAFGFHAATDAILKEVEILERAGTLQFDDARLREPFFRYYRSYRGDGVAEGDRARYLFAQPVWQPHK